MVAVEQPRRQFAPQMDVRPPGPDAGLQARHLADLSALSVKLAAHILEGQALLGELSSAAPQTSIAALARRIRKYLGMST